MDEDPPKKAAPPEVVAPAAPSTTKSAISIENTISRERFAQLSGSEPPQICAAASEAELLARAQLRDRKSVV